MEHVLFAPEKIFGKISCLCKFNAVYLPLYFWLNFLLLFIKYYFSINNILYKYMIVFTIDQGCQTQFLEGQNPAEFIFNPN